VIEGEANDNRECEEVRSSELFVHDNVREILQCAVRNDGKDAGHRMQMRAHGLQRQNRLETGRSVDSWNRTEMFQDMREGESR
jgi:hypothetical protein